MLRKKNFLVIITLLLLVLIIAGCNIPKPIKGIIKGRVLIPPEAKVLTRDISGWVPAENAAVTIKDDKGVVHIANTDSEGNFSFENLTVKSNTIVTATVKIDGKTVVLKGLIDKAVAKDENYDVGTLTPESTALALVVERLSAEGKGIDLDKIKDADSFADLIDEINGVLENHGNVIDDKDVKGLIDKIMEELFPEGEGEGEEPAPDPIQDQAAPTGLAAVPPTTCGGSNGKITGVDNTMEYKLKSASSWTAVTGTEITGLAAGTYQVRYKEKPCYNAGTPAEVTVPEGPNQDQAAPTGLAAVAPTTCGGNDGKITGTTTDMEYKLKTDTTWTDVTGTEITGLTAGTYQVRYKEKPCYNAGTPAEVTVPEGPDTVAPVPGSSGNITLTSVGATSLTVNWTKATDNITPQGNLKYFVYRSTSNNIGTVTNAENNGTLLNTGGTQDINTFNVTGLNPSTNYYFNVVVVDEAGNKAAYTSRRQRTEARALTITLYSQQNRQITITSNYGDVVTGSTVATMTSGGTSATWQDLGNNLQARVTTSFPSNMNSLVLTPNAANDRVTISGSKQSNRTVQSKTLTVVIRDRTDTTVTKSFTVVVSGSGSGTTLTIGTITP